MTKSIWKIKHIFQTAILKQCKPKKKAANFSGWAIFIQENAFHIIFGMIQPKTPTLIFVNKNKHQIVFFIKAISVARLKPILQSMSTDLFQIPLEQLKKKQTSQLHNGDFTVLKNLADNKNVIGWMYWNIED